MCAWLGYLLSDLFIDSLLLVALSDIYSLFAPFSLTRVIQTLLFSCMMMLMMATTTLALYISIYICIFYFEVLLPCLSFPFVHVYSSLSQVLLDILYCSPSLGRNYLSLVSVFWCFLHRFFFLYTNNSIIWTQQLTFSCRI